MGAANDAGKPVKILCVDDESNVLAGLELHLHRRYDLSTASSGAAGLALLESNTFAVILSDMRMPGMDGAKFLSRARQLAPDGVRMLLTGQADLDSAIAAVNEGQIFRFLMKPCAPDRLLAAFQSAVEQHRLLTAERVLLEQTLRGSVKMLTEVLALANPQAFGRANRIKDSASALAKSVSADALWEIEVAAMLSQIGCITLSTSTVDRLYGGWPLSAEDRALVESLPALADGLLANIPRLEGIRACLVNQTKRFDGTGKPVNALRAEAIPLGARVLKIVMDFDELEAQGLATSLALDTMRGRAGWYDPTLLTAFALLRGSVQTALVREMPLKLVHPGMTFAEDVKNQAGVLLLPRGYEVTEGLLERIRNFQVKGNVKLIVKNLKQEG